MTAGCLEVILCAELDTTFENDQRKFLNFRQLLGGKNFYDKIVTKNDETTNSKV